MRRVNVQLSRRAWWALKATMTYAPSHQAANTTGNRALIDAILVGDDELLRLARAKWKEWRPSR
jgi:hypothetical protein